MRHQYDEQDEDFEERPRRRRAPARSAPWGLWIGLGCGALALVGGLVAVVAVVAFVLLGKSPRPGGAVPVVAAGAPRLPGLVAYWSFDDVQGNQVLDGSGGGHHATLVGAPRLADGVRGRALWLDNRAEQDCDLGGGAELNFAADTEFTFAGWFTSGQDSATILSCRHSAGAANPQIDLVLREGRLLIMVGGDHDQAGQGLVWGAPVNDRRWHHFAFTRSGNAVELFLDGASQGRGVSPNAGEPITTDLRTLGCERLWVLQNDFRWGNPSFQGGLDEIYLFRRVLTPAEIQGLAR
jgi:hypothetical protein